MKKGFLLIKAVTVDISFCVGKKKINHKKSADISAFFMNERFVLICNIKVVVDLKNGEGRGPIPSELY